jgi:hypothetical protein
MSRFGDANQSALVRQARGRPVWQRRVGRMLLGFAIVALAEVAIHWFLGSGESAIARVARAGYLSRSGRAAVRTFLDLLFPAMVLGVLAGRVGRRWSGFAVVTWAVLLCTGVNALRPTYASFFSVADRPTVVKVNNQTKNWFGGWAFSTLVGAFAAHTVRKEGNKIRPK